MQLFENLCIFLCFFSLDISNEKFIERYVVVEKLAEERNINMKETPIEELDELWKEAKIILGSN